MEWTFNPYFSHGYTKCKFSYTCTFISILFLYKRLKFQKPATKFQYLIPIIYQELTISGANSWTGNLYSLCTGQFILIDGIA